MAALTVYNSVVPWDPLRVVQWAVWMADDLVLCLVALKVDAMELLSADEKAFPMVASSDHYWAP